MQISSTLSKKLKPRPDDHHLGFGTLFTDHMFNMDYSPEKGWHNPRIRALWPHPNGPGHDGAALRAGGF